MTKRMLIDSTHAEETRIVVLDGSRLEDFDVETSTKKQLKGNIYLAKVVRVEPSLQAAFVEYGGNRHGFLAFGEIHPDYYQIPVADRQRLLEAQAEEARAEEEAEDREAAAEAARPATAAAPADLAEPADAVPPDGLPPDDLPPDDLHDEPVAQADAALEAELQERDAPVIDTPPPETLGGTEQDGTEEARARRPPPRFLRNYKIQEVIRRRQILLIQVVKEERGTKGAALTTYISLAGRFSVLMPNSPSGGGISRKITSAADRKRLKDITSELDIPAGMGLIVRTAGANRPKPEIKRDCEYLLRLWDDIREHTMRSIAPALIYEEASLIKRAIRDVYARDVDEILVDGEPGWHAARDFMRMLMPSHARKVMLWSEGTPLFARYQVDAQLDAMLLPTVQLKSGGYLVINQAEALVAIDVNSGRSTRERGIEETALRTNLEAADEVARQLRLRDLAGLIVIDFIDMDAKKHNAMVERRLKDALKNDRARIQVGHISHFGLMEMSRQRLRPSLAETSFVTCPHCGGVGHVRSTESAAIHVLRAIEEEGAKRRAAEIVVHVATGIAMYILNHKRDRIGAIETRYAMHVAFAGDETLLPPNVRIERLRAQVVSDLPAAITPDAPAQLPAPQAAEFEPVPDDDDVVEADAVVEAEAASSDVVPGETAEEGERRRKRRRRRRRGGRHEDGTEGTESSAVADFTQGDAPTGDAQPVDALLADALSGEVEDGTDLPERLPVAEPELPVAEPELPVAEPELPVVAPEPPVAEPELSLATPEPPVAEPEPIMPEPSGLAAAIEAELTQSAPEPEAPAPETGVAEVAPPAPVEAAASEESPARRRGRRGGVRRRRVAEDPDAPPPPLDAPQPPVYTGPTPADPFAGQTFDIFDVIEPAPRKAPRSRTTVQVIAEIAPPAIVAEAEARAEDSVPAVVERASAPIVEPEPALHHVVTIEPEAPPASDPPEPLVRPILVDAEAPAGERKRGWWRR